MPGCTTPLKDCLLRATCFYCFLLPPTLPHFVPHHRLLFALVKRKTQHAGRNFSRVASEKLGKINHDGLCSSVKKLSTYSGVILALLTWQTDLAATKTRRVLGPPN